MKSLQRMNPVPATTLNKRIKVSAVPLMYQVFFTSEFFLDEFLQNVYTWYLYYLAYKLMSDKGLVCGARWVLSFVFSQVRNWEERRDTKTSGVRHKDINQHSKTRHRGTNRWVRFNKSKTPDQTTHDQRCFINPTHTRTNLHRPCLCEC